MPEWLLDVAPSSVRFFNAPLRAFVGTYTLNDARLSISSRENVVLFSVSDFSQIFMPHLSLSTVFSLATPFRQMAMDGQKLLVSWAPFDAAARKPLRRVVLTEALLATPPHNIAEIVEWWASNDLLLAMLLLWGDAKCSLYRLVSRSIDYESSRANSMPNDNDARLLASISENESATTIETIDDPVQPSVKRIRTSDDDSSTTTTSKVVCDRCCKLVDARLVTDICLDCRLDLWHRGEPRRSRRRLRHVTLGGVPDIGRSSYLSSALHLIVYTKALRNIVFASARVETRAALALQPYTFPDSVHARDLAVRLAWTPLVLRLALIDRRQQESVLLEDDVRNVRDESLISSVNHIDGYATPLKLLLRVSQNDVFACRRALAERAWHGYHGNIVENQNHRWIGVGEEAPLVEIDLTQLAPARHPLCAFLHVLHAFAGFDQAAEKMLCFGIQVKPMSLHQTLFEVAPMLRQRLAEFPTVELLFLLVNQQQSSDRAIRHSSDELQSENRLPPIILDLTHESSATPLSFKLCAFVECFGNDHNSFATIVPMPVTHSPGVDPKVQLWRRFSASRHQTRPVTSLNCTGAQLMLYARQDVGLR